MTAPATFCDECGASNPLQATQCFACNAALHLPASSPLFPNQAGLTNTAISTNKVILAPSYLLHSRYSIVRQIGTGGFGAVYQAKDTLFSHRLVAIKEMSQDGLTQRSWPRPPLPLNGKRSCLLILLIPISRVFMITSSPPHPLIGNTPDISSPTLVPSPANATILSQPLYTYRGHEGSVTAVAWSPHGKYIASADTVDGSVQVWDASTGTIILIPTLAIDSTEKRLPVQTSMPAYFATYNQRVDALAWSSDSTRIASALGNDTVDVCSIKTGDAILFPFSPPGNVNAVAWSPDGASIAAVSGNISIQVRSATTGDLSLTYTGHGQAVLTLAWSPDGKQIASGGVDGIVQVWDAARGYTYMTYRGHIAEVNAVAWSPDSKQIASGGTDGTVQVWDAATGSILFTYRGHAGGVNTVAWQPQQPLLSGHEARIASGGADATVQVP